MVIINPNKEYNRLGIRGKVHGVFIRETVKGGVIKSKKLNQAKENWFVYSRLFAHNGSFAFIDQNTAGGVFSGEFPTFELLFKKYNEMDLLEYLSFYYSSPQVLSLITRLTTGSTKESRARFKEEQFNELFIPIPKEESVFLEIVSSIRQIKGLERDIKVLSDNILDLPMSFQSTLPFKE